MSKVTNKRALYTLEFKQEAVRVVQSGRSCVSVAKEFGIASQTLDNWVKLLRDGKLGAVNAKPITAEPLVTTAYINGLKTEPIKTGWQSNLMAA